MALLAKSAPGGRGSVSGANVAPPATPAAIGVWPHLLIGADPVTAALKPHTSLAEPVEGRLS